ncbi:MAG TPA: primosomal protein N' [Patescibacteria group bacterium]|nr:primosomal protein N' [Patescibacteria group bacterium]
MYFYELWVRSNRYHGSEPLTYYSKQQLPIGSLVSVPLQHQHVLAVVTQKVPKPVFKTKAIEHVYGLPPVPAKLLQLGEWLRAYYPAPLGIIAQQLVPAGLSDKTPKETAKKALNTKVVQKQQGSQPLTKQQLESLAAIKKPGTYLLHGITGSGKTRVYVELAAQVLKAGKSAVILTPEISLTSQLAAGFQRVFGNDVVILHSQLSPAQRREVWQQILQASRPLVVIGPRSALFSPLANIGLIVLDESHEPAYKQEQAPHYQAGRVAAKLAQLHGATLVLGSATPSVSDYYLAEQKGKPILQLTELATQNGGRGTGVGERKNGTRNPEPGTRIEVVDLKERSLLPRNPYLSQPLLNAIEAALLRKEQVLLYLNRRGTARIILCENCGWQAMCPHCDLPLTYHGDSHLLRCHVCNHHEPAPAACPVCKHPSIIFRAVGTKAVEDDVRRLFPGARVQRFDTDNLKAERFEQHYGAVHAGDVDILVGTQLLAKGLDLPRLSTLGIITADTSLAMPDFSANERTYQLLSQVLGRVGRGHIAGTAIIQTYQPDHPAVRAAIDGNWREFYESELESRKLFNFPPFVYMLKLTVRRASIKAAEKAALDFAQLLQGRALKIEIDGPAPAFHEKFQNKYQWQLVLKAKDRSQLLEVIKLLPSSGWSYDIDPIDLL